VCCSVLQCVAVCCSVLQYVAYLGNNQIDLRRVSARHRTLHTHISGDTHRGLYLLVCCSVCCSAWCSVQCSLWCNVWCSVPCSLWCSAWCSVPCSLWCSAWCSAWYSVCCSVCVAVCVLQCVCCSVRCSVYHLTQDNKTHVTQPHPPHTCVCTHITLMHDTVTSHIRTYLYLDVHRQKDPYHAFPPSTFVCMYPPPATLHTTHSSLG